jgi:hypothetical protein
MAQIHPVFHVSRLLPWADNVDEEFPGRDIPDQPIQDAREYIHGDNAFTVSSIIDCKIDIDAHSRARPKASCLFFKIRWAPPFDDPTHDSWEPMRAVTKLDAFKTFLRTPQWQAFAATDAYKAFAVKYKSKTPKIVHFADA